MHLALSVWSYEHPARVAELADALASGASVLIGRAGSSPAPGTIVKSRDIVPISVSRDFLRFGGSFSRFHRVGCGGIFWFCLSGIGPRFRLCGG